MFGFAYARGSNNLNRMVMFQLSGISTFMPNKSTLKVHASDSIMAGISAMVRVKLLTA